VCHRGSAAATSRRSQYATMLKRGELATADPLGLCGLLIDAYRVQQLMQQGAQLLQWLMQYLPLCDEIEAIWRDPEQQRAATWTEHQDINEVMLATSLAPDGLLVLLPPDN